MTTSVLQSIYNAEDEYVGTVALPCEACSDDRAPRELTATGWACVAHRGTLGHQIDRRHGGRA